MRTDPGSWWQAPTPQPAPPTTNPIPWWQTAWQPAQPAPVAPKFVQAKPVSNNDIWLGQLQANVSRSRGNGGIIAQRAPAQPPNPNVSYQGQQATVIPQGGGGKPLYSPTQPPAAPAYSGQGTYAPANYYNTATPFSTGQAPYAGQGTYMPNAYPTGSNVYGPEIYAKQMEMQNAAPAFQAQAQAASTWDFGKWFGNAMIKGQQAVTSLNRATAPGKTSPGGGPVDPYARNLAQNAQYYNASQASWDDAYIAELQAFKNYWESQANTNMPGLTTGGAGGGGGGYPTSYGGGGGYGGYGSSAAGTRFYLDPTVWRI